MTITTSRNTPRIGVFLSEFGGYQEMILEGAINYARDHHANLVCFVGGAINDVTTDLRLGNVIYSLANEKNLDGLILLTGTLQINITQDEMLKFCANYSKIPMVSVGTSIPGLPSLTVDNTAGLRAMMAHFIEVHGFKRIAFIRGPENNEDADARYAIYRESLQQYGIPYADDLLVLGDFLTESGIRAVRTLLDERKVEFQAIVASNDNMALGAQTELLNRGVRVPANVAVAGFDDIDQAKTSVVPLTTIRQPLRELGEQAVQMMLDYLGQKTAPAHKTLETKLVIRESCGCLSPVIANIVAYNTPTAESSRDRADFFDLIKSSLRERFQNLDELLIKDILDSFIDEAEGKSRRFLDTLIIAIRTSIEQSDSNEITHRGFDVWQDVLSILHSVVLPQCQLGVPAEHINVVLQQGRALITEFLTRAFFAVSSQSGSLTLIQNGITRNLGATSTLEQVADVLADGLQWLGIQQCYIALTLPAGQSRLILALDGQKRIGLGTEGRIFTSEELLPSDVMPETLPPALMIRALFSGNMHLGYILTSLEPGIRSMYETYQELARNISSAIKSVLLLRQIADANERLAERAAELAQANERLEALNLELELAQRRTEQLSNAKSVFLSNMSHELRTPLNVIIGYSTSMLKMPQMFDNVPVSDAHRPYVELIGENGQYLVGLINDILDLSKIEAGKLELHLQTINLRDLLRGVLATSVGLVKDKPVHLEPDIPDNLPLVWVDPLRVRQITLNLLSNAIKFTDTGSVTLSARVDDSDRNFVCVSVSDTGIGIPESALAAIFDRFEQAEHDTDSRYGGTGLGLDISKQLSQMHGGDMTVKSVVGQGSTFSFTVPISQETQIAPDRSLYEFDDGVKVFAPSDQITIDPKIIMVVEDEVRTREMLHRALDTAGFVVVDTHDGAHALDLVLGLLPHLIILDIQLPDISGWEVLQQFKANPETAPIPVIVYTIDEDSQRATDLGAALYIQKPLEMEAMLAHVQQILASVATSESEHS